MTKRACSCCFYPPLRNTALPLLISFQRHKCYITAPFNAIEPEMLPDGWLRTLRLWLALLYFSTEWWMSLWLLSLWRVMDMFMYNEVWAYTCFQQGWPCADSLPTAICQAFHIWNEWAQLKGISCSLKCFDELRNIFGLLPSTDPVMKLSFNTLTALMYTFLLSTRSVWVCVWTAGWKKKQTLRAAVSVHLRNRWSLKSRCSHLSSSF